MFHVFVVCINTNGVRHLFGCTGRNESVSQSSHVGWGVGGCWSLSQLQVEEGEGQGTPLQKLPAHHRALCEQLGVGHLPQGYLKDTLRGSWHLSCYHHIFQLLFVTGA